MIHHQHFFPITSDQGKLLPVFLAVLNMEPEQPEVISRNMERVLTARLRDAQFFYQTRSRRSRWPTHRRAARHGAVPQEARHLSAKGRSASQKLARWICGDVFGRAASRGVRALKAGRLCKADLATDMVRELTELQGTMGGIYAREDGRPEEVWKAIYFHYLPVGVEATAPPTKEQLGKAAITWAAVSLADKLDTVDRHVRRRRAADRIARSVRSAPRGAGHRAHPRRPAGADRARPAFTLGDWFRLRSSCFGATRPWTRRSGRSWRIACALCSNSVATTPATSARSRIPRSRSCQPLVAKRKLEALPEFTETEEFRQLAVLVQARARTSRRTSMRPRRIWAAS